MWSDTQFELIVFVSVIEIHHFLVINSLLLNVFMCLDLIIVCKTLCRCYATVIICFCELIKGIPAQSEQSKWSYGSPRIYYGEGGAMGGWWGGGFCV